MVELDYNKKDGSTKREHYGMIQKLSGIPQEILEIPKLDVNAMYLLEMFYELSSTRGMRDSGGLRPITYTEMHSYSTMTGTEFEPWETDIIKSVDRTYIKSVYEQRDEDKSEAPS